MADRELQFENVLSGGSAEKRTALIVFPIVVVLAIVIGFAVVAISRMSGLSTQVRMANQQVDEANKVVEERDKQLRDARAEVSVLASPGQGGGVLTAAVKDSGASGVALVHPEQHALNVYAFNLSPPPEGQAYRLVVTDAEGHEKVLAAITPDDRGAAYLLARDVPEAVTKVRVVAMPAGAAAQGANTAAQGGEAAAPQRQTVLAGDLPRPGEAGIVMPQPQAPPVQARTPAGQGKRRGR